MLTNLPPGLIRFHPLSSPSSILIGEPTSLDVDVGRAILTSNDDDDKPVQATVYSGSSVLAPGTATSRTETIHKLLSPLSASELGGGCIRCIGLNYRAHAAEAGLEEPKVPPVFIKPSTALGNPWPTETCPLPRQSVESQSGDWEAELAVVLGREVRNVDEKEVEAGMKGEGRLNGVVLGYTAANDVSCRQAQFEQSQYCYSKGFDGACPLGKCACSAIFVSAWKRNGGKELVCGAEEGSLWRKRLLICRTSAMKDMDGIFARDQRLTHAFAL